MGRGERGERREERGERKEERGEYGLNYICEIFKSCKAL
jgi:hypothetical protein